MQHDSGRRWCPTKFPAQFTAPLSPTLRTSPSMERPEPEQLSVSNLAEDEEMSRRVTEIDGVKITFCPPAEDKPLKTFMASRDDSKLPAQQYFRMMARRIGRTR